MNPLYSQVAQRARHRCEYCHAPEVIFNFHFELEHIVPSSRQGANDETNLALCCRACNLRKSDHVTGVDEIDQKEVPLFHPRQDQWEKHFQVDSETGEILALTPTGRATVTRLDLNAPTQLLARVQWMRLRLYP